MFPYHLYNQEGQPWPLGSTYTCALQPITYALNKVVNRNTESAFISTYYVSMLEGMLECRFYVVGTTSR